MPAEAPRTTATKCSPSPSTPTARHCLDIARIGAWNVAAIQHERPALGVHSGATHDSRRGRAEIVGIPSAEHPVPAPDRQGFRAAREGCAVDQQQRAERRVVNQVGLGANAGRHVGGGLGIRGARRRGPSSCWWHGCRGHRRRSRWRTCWRRGSRLGGEAGRATLSGCGGCGGSGGRRLVAAPTGEQGHGKRNDCCDLHVGTVPTDYCDRM